VVRSPSIPRVSIGHQHRSRATFGGRSLDVTVSPSRATHSWPRAHSDQFWYPISSLTIEILLNSFAKFMLIRSIEELLETSCLH
jgi:hypothetical protein